MRHSMRMPLLPSPHSRKPAVRLSRLQMILVGAQVRDLEALVGIDVGRQEPGELPRIFELAGDP